MQTQEFRVLAEKYLEFHKALRDANDYCWTGYDQTDGLASLNWKDASDLISTIERGIEGSMGELLRVLPMLERKTA